ncbi:unnamed protein product, partial [Mesorhabditis spiculigera]
MEESGATVEATEVDNETLNQLNAHFLATAAKGMVADVKTEQECHDFNYQLIQEVKKRPCLYDMNDDTYNNNTMRAAMWAEIGQRFSTSPDFVKTRWKTMRDRYKKEEKRWKAGKLTAWTFFQHLHFISPYLRARYPHDPEERSVDCQQSDEEGSPQPTLLDIIASTTAMAEEATVKADGPARKRVKYEEKEERPETSVPSPLSINTASSPSATTAGQSTPVSMGSSAGTMQPCVKTEHNSSCSSSALAPPTWNRLQDEGAEMFGHMVAMKLATMPPKLREKTKHVPFTLPMNEPPIPGSVIEVHGHHKHHEVFVVELLSGPHVVLHLSFRFHPHELVLNSSAHGNWAHEEKTHNPVPKHDHHFTLKIKVQTTHYDIEVDGHHVATFNHRYPFATVQALGVHGDVHIKDVHFQGFHFQNQWGNQHDFGHGGYQAYGTPSYVPPVFQDNHPHNTHYDPYR